MHQVSGGCYCGNILMDLELTAAPETYHPRACDCDYCRKHGSAYLSDPNGSMVLRIGNAKDRGAYRQGSGQAEFVLCRNCGVLVAVLHRSEQRLYATANARAIDPSVTLASDKGVSPKTLAPEAKAKRWQDVWFSNVEIREVTLHLEDRPRIR